MELKVDDKVKILKGGGFLNHMLGLIGIIEYISKSAELPYHVKSKTQSGNFAEDELERVE